MTSTHTQPALTTKMKELMVRLREIARNDEVISAYNNAINHVTDHVDVIGPAEKNPWKGQPIRYFVDYFEKWFTYLPTPNGGLGEIIPFTYFYLHNPHAYHFLNRLETQTAPNTEPSTEIFNWIRAFVVERGHFMDSESSAVYVDCWMNSMHKEMDNFIVPEGGYKTFNQFFTRQLKPEAKARPIADTNDDAIVVAPADSVIHSINSDLTCDTKLNVKSRQLAVNDLLQGSKFAPCFEGGTAISCVLMPQNYHHYHAPVGGKIVEGVEVPGIYFGMIDGDHFLDHMHFADSNAEFSLFEDFHRAYYIIETEDYGYVAVVPVGLNTISSINRSLVCNNMVKPGGTPVKVEKGQELGYFAYGGSLNILMFQKGVLPTLSVQLEMGRRIGSMSKVTRAARQSTENADTADKTDLPGATPA